jgi:hypothetical protein
VAEKDDITMPELAAELAVSAGVALSRLERLIRREFPGITDDELVAALSILREALEPQIDHKTMHPNGRQK